MKIVYIAGPFRGLTNYQIKCNVRRAEAAGLEVCKLGAMALIPHKNTEEFQGELPDEFWLDGTLALLRRSDALLAIEGWERSSGSRGEIGEANKLHIPVFYTIEEVRAWLEKTSSWQSKDLRVDYRDGSAQVTLVNTFSTRGGVQPPHWRGEEPNQRPPGRECPGRE